MSAGHEHPAGVSTIGRFLVACLGGLFSVSGSLAVAFQIEDVAVVD